MTESALPNLTRVMKMATFAHNFTNGTNMKLSIVHFSLLLSLGTSFVDGFAPRPPAYNPSLRNRPMTARTAMPVLRASTLDLQDVETETTIPFYAKQDVPILSSDDYQRPQASLSNAITTANRPQASVSTEIATTTDEKEGNFVEFAALGTWITGLSSFLLINNFVGPWPAALLAAIPVKAFGLTHALAGMLFGGGIILTTLIEWLATDSKNSNVLNFYFDKVPALDSLVVLPALTASILSGVGLSVDHYGSLGDSPFHVVGAISTLLAFAIWWAATDLTTQGAAMEAIKEWTKGDPENTDVPQIVNFRKFSNVVSCLFVAAIYGFMVLKPGFTPPIAV